MTLYNRNRKWKHYVSVHYGYYGSIRYFSNADVIWQVNSWCKVICNSYIKADLTIAIL